MLVTLGIVFGDIGTSPLYVMKAILHKMCIRDRIAAFVTILQMLMSAYAPDSINQALGIYIPLIVVNCIILGLSLIHIW